MDDVLITSSSSTQVQDFITQLQTSFALKDLEVPSYFLRLELTYTFQGVLLSQHKYIIDVLQKAHMDQTKPISTPMASGTSLSANSGDVFGDLHLYRSIVVVYNMPLSLALKLLSLLIAYVNSCTNHCN